MNRLTLTVTLDAPPHFTTTGYVSHLTDTTISLTWHSGGGKGFDRATGRQIRGPKDSEDRAWVISPADRERIEALYRETRVCGKCHGCGRAPVDGEADRGLRAVERELRYPRCGRCEGLRREKR